MSFGSNLAVHERGARAVPGALWGPGEGIGVVITGNQDVERMLKTIRNDLARRRIMTAVRKGAEVVRDEMKTRAPVRSTAAYNLWLWAEKKKARPGTMRDTMTVQKLRTNDPREVVYAAGPGKAAWYARFVVLGHRIRLPSGGAFGGRTGGSTKSGRLLEKHVPPHDFMTPAAQAAADPAIHEAAGYLERSLRRWHRRHGTGYGYGTG